MRLCCCYCCSVASVVSDSVRPCRRQPTRLPHPWDSPGKSTGVGCHFLLQCMKVKRESEVAQSCPTLHDSMDCSPPGSSIHGIFQARVLEWGAVAFSIWDSRSCLNSMDNVHFCVLAGSGPCWFRLRVAASFLWNKISVSVWFSKPVVRCCLDLSCVYLPIGQFEIGDFVSLFDSQPFWFVT